MSHVNPITVMSWSEFIADPPAMYGLFLPTPGVVRYNTNRVMPLLPVRGAGLDKNKQPRLLHVETIDELRALKSKMLGKPILIRSQINYRQTRNYAVVRVTTVWRGDFAVLLNTLHPSVAGPVEKLFEDAEQRLLEGQKFCIELDLTDALEAWYADILDTDDMCSVGRISSSQTRIYITNYSKYQHCFDCNKYWCLLGWPCWLLSAPCYMIHRSCHVDDLDHHFNIRNTPVLYRTPVSNGLVDIMSDHQVSVSMPSDRSPPTSQPRQPPDPAQYPVVVGPPPPRLPAPPHFPSRHQPAPPYSARSPAFQPPPAPPNYWPQMPAGPTALAPPAYEEVCTDSVPVIPTVTDQPESQQPMSTLLHEDVSTA